MMLSVTFLIPVLALIFLLVNLYRWRAAVMETNMPRRIYYFRLSLGCALFLAPIILNLVRFIGFRLFRIGLFGYWSSMLFLCLSSLSLAVGLWLLATAWFFRWLAARQKMPQPTVRPPDIDGEWPPPPKSPSANGPN